MALRRQDETNYANYVAALDKWNAKNVNHAILDGPHPGDCPQMPPILSAFYKKHGVSALKKSLKQKRSHLPSRTAFGGAGEEPFLGLLDAPPHIPNPLDGEGALLPAFSYRDPVGQGSSIDTTMGNFVTPETPGSCEATTTLGIPNLAVESYLFGSTILPFHGGVLDDLNDDDFDEHSLFAVMRGSFVKGPND
ncbi:uncharacterized protein FIBRA_09513 [Fibroporia radiculosa]|uniref:Uncharacterized protein n=1 Tax=Fibroporia radiculosa TaxID=599839 RepID=J7S6L6_9APHY|nr:uncharacterized protein FIBRA_09513 [Fibroporia radiculosa]CCM07174.1 predicted protein [Fibroporia radiculosa]